MQSEFHGVVVSSKRFNVSQFCSLIFVPDLGCLLVPYYSNFIIRGKVRTVWWTGSINCSIYLPGIEILTFGDSVGVRTHDEGNFKSSSSFVEGGMTPLQLEIFRMVESVRLALCR